MSQGHGKKQLCLMTNKYHINHNNDNDDKNDDCNIDDDCDNDDDINSI